MRARVEAPSGEADPSPKVYLVQSLSTHSVAPLTSTRMEPSLRLIIAVARFLPELKGKICPRKERQRLEYRRTPTF